MTREEFKEIRDYFDGKFEALEERLETEFQAITEHFVEQRKYIEAGHEGLESRITRAVAHDPERTGSRSLARTVLADREASVREMFRLMDAHPGRSKGRRWRRAGLHAR